MALDFSNLGGFGRFKTGVHEAYVNGVIGIPPIVTPWWEMDNVGAQLPLLCDVSWVGFDAEEGVTHSSGSPGNS